MKPHHSADRRFALPTLIVLTAFAPLAQSGIISPDPFGDVVVPAGTNAANTVNATGGSSPTPFVTIQQGATLTGDATEQIGVNVSAPGYTIDNSGVLDVALQGVFASIPASSNLQIINNSSGLIQGGSTGIYFAGNGGVISNSGTISGITGVTSYGIDGLLDLSVTNSGTISGNAAGIRAGANLVVSNSVTGVIQGVTGITVDANLAPGFLQVVTANFVNGSSRITNSGVIRSTVSGGNAFLGGIGTDDLFLNLGSFVQGNIIGGGGIDTLTFDGGLTSPSSAVNAVRGSVIGFDHITKQGSGVAFIGTVEDQNSGLEVSANVIEITGGGLYINADVVGSTSFLPTLSATVAQAVSPLATINANGTALGGTGLWNANVNINSGGISAGAIPINLDSNPENAVGGLSIAGNVVHQPGSFIRVDIIPDTVISPGINSDLITQLGAGNTYNVTGANLRLSPTTPSRVITPGTYTLIDSAEPIVGFGSLGTLGIQFNNNTPDSGFTATGSGPNYQNSVLTNFFATPGLADGGTNLVLGIDYGFGSLPGLSRNQSAVGTALDTLALQAGTGSLGAQEQDLIAALALSDLSAVQASLAALSPQASLALAVGIVNSNYRIHQMVQDRLAMMRSPSETMTTPAPAMDAKGGMIPAEPIRSSTANSVWGSLSYDWQDFEDGNSGNDFDGDTGAITLGYDYRVSPLFLIGGLLDGSQSDFDDSSGDSDIDTFRVAVYGTYGEALGIYSDFLLGYGTHELDQNGGGISGLNTSSSDAESFQALLTVGYAMGNEEVKHGPFAGLEYQRIWVDGFTQGGGLIDVPVNDYDIDSLRGLIGYRVNARYGAFRPFASVAYAYEFENDAPSSTASIGGVPFSVLGPELQSSVIITAGTGYSFSENLMMNISYRGDISVESDGMTSNGISLGLSYSF